MSDYAGLMVVRVVAGLLEAAVLPAIVLLCGQYYTPSEQAFRFPFWYAGVGFGQIVGAFISWAFQHVSPTAPLSSWRIMYIVLGLVTIFFGVSVFLFIPATPMSARFLSDREKIILLEHVRQNQTGIKNKLFQPKQIVEALLSVPFWTINLIVLCVSPARSFERLGQR